MQTNQIRFGITVIWGFRNYESQGVYCKPVHRFVGIFWDSWLGFLSYLRTMQYWLPFVGFGHFLVSRLICPSSSLQRRDWLHKAQGASLQQVRAETCLTWLTASPRRHRPLSGHVSMPEPFPVKPYHLPLLKARSSGSHILFSKRTLLTGKRLKALSLAKSLTGY